jgi:polar amino acid transport system substrate-binding protein
MKKTITAAVSAIAILFAGCLSNKSSTTFRLGFDPSFIPLNTMGQEANLSGYAQEFFSQVGKNLNESIELLKFSWDDLLPQLKNNKVDGIITTLNPYNFYKKDFDFSNPLIKTGPCLVSNKNAVFKSFESLDGKILGIITSSSGEILASTQAHASIQSFDNPSSMLDALSRSQIDACLLDYLIAFAYCRDLFQNTLVISSDPFGDSGIRFMIKKTHPEKDRLISSINDLTSSSKNDEFIKKWQLPE